MKKPAIAAFVVAVALPLLAADQASAGIGVLPASACTPIGGSPVYAVDALYNSSTTDWMSIHCTVPTNFSGLDAPFVERVEVSLVDRNAANSVTGRIRVVDVAGFTNYTSPLIVSVTSENSSHGFNANSIGMTYFAGTVGVAAGAASSQRSGIRSLIVSTE